jgi:hypothetical protein
MNRTGARATAHQTARVKPAWIGQPHGRTGISRRACVHMRETIIGNVCAQMFVHVTRDTRAHPCARALRGFAGDLPVRIPVRLPVRCARARLRAHSPVFFIKKSGEME